MSTFETVPYKITIRKDSPKNCLFLKPTKMDSFRKPSANKKRSNETEVKTIRLKFEGVIGLREIILNELQSLYYTEKALLKAFPKMIKNACSFELIEAITIHFEETKQQVIRIEDAFLALNKNPTLKRCQAVEQLIQDVENTIENTKFGTIRDAGILLSLQKIEHYEIAAYSILSTYAENSNENAIAELLAISLNEEKVAELRLEKISNSIRFDS